MLREFRVDNFKSLINVSFEPGSVNLLIGRNNSGKTNLCQALRFVSGSSVGKLDEAADVAAGMQFGMTNFALDKSTIDFTVRAELPRGGERLAFEYELTVSPSLPGSGETATQLEREVLRVVGILKTLFEMADPPPAGPQLVFTSHAPYFIDLFDDRLDGIFLFDRDKGHTSITRPDPARVKARLEDFPLGEQHFRDMLRR